MKCTLCAIMHCSTQHYGDDELMMIHSKCRQHKLPYLLLVLPCAKTSPRKKITIDQSCRVEIYMYLGPRAGITMFDDRKCSNPSSLCWAYLMSALIMMMISEGVFKKHGCAVGYIANVNYINVCLLQIINHCYISRLRMKMNKDRSYRNLII